MIRLLLVLAILAQPVSASTTQLNCLAETIYYEARGEPEIGQLAVAYVVLNRQRHPDFPDTICKVVYQKGQFSWSAKKPSIRSSKAWNKAKQLAQKAVIKYALSEDNTKGAIYFQVSGRKQSYHKRKTTEIGNHSFFQ